MESRLKGNQYTRTHQAHSHGYPQYPWLDEVRSSADAQGSAKLRGLTRLSGSEAPPALNPASRSNHALPNHTHTAPNDCRPHGCEAKTGERSPAPRSGRNEDETQTASSVEPDPNGLANRLIEGL